MIYTDRTITVRKGESKIDEPIVVYRGDYELEVRFTITNSRFKFMSGTNLIETEKASFGQMAILTPYGGNIFSDIVRCSDGTVTFVLTESMINQIEEIGLYSFQIRLYDYNKESRVSIPPIEYGIEVREPIASEDHDNSVNNAIVGYSIAKVVDGLNEDVPDTFDANGQYNKTDWETGDRISQGKLNKIEDAIDQINQNEKNDVAALDKRVTNNHNILETTKANVSDITDMKKQIDALVLESGGDSNLEVVQARGNFNTLNNRLTFKDNADKRTSKRLLGTNIYDFSSQGWEKGFLNSNGTVTVASNTAYSNIKIPLSDAISIECKKGFSYGKSYPILMLDSSGAVVRCIPNSDGEATSLTDPIIIQPKPNEAFIWYFYSREHINDEDAYVIIQYQDSIDAKDKRVCMNEALIDGMSDNILGMRCYVYDALTWNGGFFNKNGSITSSNETYEYTYISLDNINKVRCKRGFTYNDNYPILLLDKNDNVTRTIHDSSDPITIHPRDNEVKMGYFYSDQVISNDEVYILTYCKNESILSSMQDQIDYINKNIAYDIYEIPYNSLEWQDGCINNGKVITTIPGFLTTFIDVSKYSEILYNTASHSYISNYHNAFYDADMNFIGNDIDYGTGVDEDVYVKIPDQAKYFGFFVEYVDANSDYNYITLSNDTSEDVNSQTKEYIYDQLGGIVYSREDFQWGHHYYMDGELSQSTINSPNDHYRNCEINVAGVNKVSYVKGFNYFDKYRCCFLDIDRNLVQNITTDDAAAIGDEITVDVPPNAVIFCYYTKYPMFDEIYIKFKLYKENGLLDINNVGGKSGNFNDISKVNVIKKPYNLSERKVLFLGDSITQGFTDTSAVTQENWVKHFTSYNNITKFYNYAAAGSTWSTQLGNENYIVTQMNRAITDNLDVDLIIIAEGTNDYGNRLVLGSKDDIANTTVYGGINQIISLLKTNFPNAEVIFISPIPRLNISNEEAPLDDYRKAIFIKAVLNGYDFIDGSAFPFDTVRGDYMTATMNDGLHPSLLGHILYAKYVSSILN